MRIVKIFIWTGCCRAGQERARPGGGVNEVSGNWRRQHRTWTQQTCLHIFGCSISNVNRQARNTPSTHTPVTHIDTLASCLVCACVVLGFGCWHFSVAAFSSRSATSKSNALPNTDSLFFFFLVFAIFPFHFWLCFLFFFLFVIAFFILFMLLSLHFTAIALAFKHKNLQQFFVLGLTKICFAKYEG